jgi:CheY-like chemotaxis protein
VEDNVEVSAINADLLRGLGYSVEAVTNARAALERLEGHPPDLLLTDVVLPDGISGLELAREVRRCYPNLPVLLATGYSDVLLARPGEFRVLRKPFSLRQLDDALDREFRRRPHTASARAERVA